MKFQKLYEEVASVPKQSFDDILRKMAEDGRVTIKEKYGKIVSVEITKKGGESIQNNSQNTTGTTVTEVDVNDTSPQENAILIQLAVSEHRSHHGRLFGGFRQPKKLQPDPTNGLVNDLTHVVEHETVSPSNVIDNEKASD